MNTITTMIAVMSITIIMPMMCFSPDDIRKAFDAFESDSSFGKIIRAKGILHSNAGSWFHFDYVPGSLNIEPAVPATTGKLAVIGTGINKEKIFRICAFPEQKKT